MARTVVRRGTAKKTSAKPGPQEGAGRSAAKGKGDDINEDELLKLVPPGLAAAYVNSKLHDKQLTLAGLGAPKDWEGEMPEVPEDIATEDHDSLSNLLAAFSNALSTALWQASMAYIEAEFFSDIAEYLENVAIVDSTESNDTKRKADARTNESVVGAKALHRSRYSDYVRFRDLAKTLEHRLRTVSRVGGFVGDEAEAEDARASKPSTRGKSAGASKGTARGSGRRVSRR
jgi:hypothetical protein